MASGVANGEPGDIRYYSKQFMTARQFLKSLREAIAAASAIHG
jgi:hypothetical protein